MAQNSSVPIALVAQPVPPDRECVTTLTEILQGAVDFLAFDLLASLEQGSAFPTTNNTAQQALNTANSALAIAETLQGQQPKLRYSGETPIALSTGDPTVTFAFGTPMPDSNYEVRVTFFGPVGSAGSYTYKVIDGSRSAGGCSIQFNNIPANTSYIAVAQQLITIT